MQTEIKNITQCLKELTITVPKEKAKKDYEEIVRNFKNYVVVPGYRKGKAPLSMVVNMFGSRLKETYLKEKLSEYITEVFKEKDINPINEPEVKSLDWEPDTDLNATITYELSPQIELKQYTGLKIPYLEVQKKKENIDSFILQQQEAMAEMTENQGAKICKDHAISFEVTEIDNQTTKDQVEEESENKQKINPENSDPETYKQVILTKNNFGEEFTKNVVGLAVGDTTEAVIKSQTGEDEKKKIKITHIYDVKLPDLNEDFAKTFDFATMDELRTGIEKELENYVESETLKNQILAIDQALLENNPFDLPPTPVANYAENLAEGYAKNYNIPLDNCIEILKPAAEQEMKKYLFYNYLQETIKIEPNKEEEETLLKEFADQLKISVEDLIKRDPDVTKKPEFVQKLKDKALYRYLIENNELYPKEPEQEEPEDPEKDKQQGKEQEEKTEK